MSNQTDPTPQRVEWTEERIRAFMAEHTAFKRYAEPLIRQYWMVANAAGTCDFPDFEGFTQHHFKGGEEWHARFIERYADEDTGDTRHYDMPITVLWDGEWVAKLRANQEEERTRWRREEEERQRKYYETLKAKFEGTP